MAYDLMRLPSRRTAGVAFASALALVALVFASAAQSSPTMIQTGFYDPNASAGGREGIGWASASLAYGRSRLAGAGVVRIPLFWNRIAPETEPPDWVAVPALAANPADPNYGDRWKLLDQEVRTAIAKHLKPLLVLRDAPIWAERGPHYATRPGVSDPDPADYGRFAKAVALRYGGSFLTLPRVRLYQAWNEPNNEWYFRPQFELIDGVRTPVSPKKYRYLVNALTTAVRAVHGDNLVVAGGSSPLGKPGTVAPLRFMRILLGKKTKFDIWAHHPYTSGGPTHSSSKRDDIQIGDLPRMRTVLTRAINAGHVGTSRTVKFWVTEFSWDTNPPDSCGVPIKRHARWVSEALYRMWKAGVSLVTWTQLRDYPIGWWYQGGFYQWDGDRDIDKFDKPKYSLRAFKFPFVALKRTGGIYVWGRTPWGARGRVVIERRTSSGWVRMTRFRTNGYGLFQKAIATSHRTGQVRARKAGTSVRSVPFTLLTATEDVYVRPIGCK